MNIRHRSLGRWQKIVFPVSAGIVAFLDRVRLIDEFRELSDADHAFAIDDVWWRDLGVAMDSAVQIEQELDQSAFEFRAPICVEQKAAPR